MNAATPNMTDPSVRQVSGYRIFSRVAEWITHDRTQLINITERINEIVRKSGVRDGLVHLQSLHNTTAVFLNEWQDALLDDVKHFLDAMIEDHSWRNSGLKYSVVERQQADANLRGMVMGQTLVLQVRDSNVVIGDWQSIVLAEFDGPQNRSVSIQVSGI
jgi:secondary thiamine-phosphate synthase enzyme